MTSGASPPEVRLQASVVVLVPAWRLDRVFDYAVPDALAATVEVGSLVRVPLGRRRVRGVVVELAERRAERALEDVAAVAGPAPVAPPPLPELVEWVALRYGTPRGRAFGRVVPPRIRVTVAEPASLDGGPAPGRILGYRGGAELVSAIERSELGTWSVQALPGEDRGALAAELVAAAGRAGRGAALVAVPEVRYGSAVLDALATQWADLARVDAARPPAERSKAWLRLARGHGLGAGGRSTVLAPAPELRLVVVDDEHHPSYKEDSAPRYDARRVAVERARRQGATCVLISVTPSLETWREIAAGRIGVVAPSREAQRAARPAVELVARPRDRVLSAAVHRRVARALQAGRRVALLAPARGYARAVWCASCHCSLRCPRCEAGMGLDRRPAGADNARVRCPRCGFSAPPPGVCPVCDAVQWRYIGAGSERLGEQVARAWPRAVVARVDPDVVGDELARAPDIYVTTWIGTKPALRPDVSLVVVLDADALIRRPDYRAAERAHEALAAMAEWAGPGARGGRLVIQCSDPGHHAVQAVARADVAHFVETELAQRAELGYPPFRQLIKATATGPERAATVDAVAARCRAAGAAVLGPVAATVSGDRALEGTQILAKCADAGAVAAGLRDILAAVPAGTRLRLDVDAR